MKSFRGTTILSRLPSALALAACLLGGLAPCVPGAPLREAVDRKYRASFLSPDLQKDYYRIQNNTVKFLDRQQSDINGLIESFRGTSVYAYDIFTRAFCYGNGGVLDCQSFTYDGALAIMVYALSGQPRKAADLLSVYRREFYMIKNDRLGLFNSYRSDLASRHGLTLGIDGDRIHVGPTVWVGMAALQYTALTGDARYLDFALDIALWAQHLEHSRLKDGRRGAVCMGSGWGPDWAKVFSTENNIDYYAFLAMLRKIHERGTPATRRAFEKKNYLLSNIEREQEGILGWLKESVFIREIHCFGCGANESGVDPIRALDTLSWSISGVGPAKLQEIGVDPFELVKSAEKYFGVEDTINGEKIKGFDFTDGTGRNVPLRMIWFEGTGQQIVAYQVMAQYALSLGREDKYEEYRAKALRYSDEMARASKRMRIIDGALAYTSKCPSEKEIIMTFIYEWEVPRGNKGQWVASVSSTVWRYFAAAAFNPLVFDTSHVSYLLFR